MISCQKNCNVFMCPSKKKNPDLGDMLIGFPKDYTVLDLETTGLNPLTDLIIEFAAVKVRDGKVCDTFQSLCDPGFPIPAVIEAITGITSEMVRFAPNPRKVLPDFLDFVGDDFVVGHNVLFDARFIAASNGDFKNPLIDTMRIFRKLHPSLPHHRLSDMVSFYNTKNDSAHRALSDCYATQSCFCFMNKEVIDTYKDTNEFLKTLK